MFGPGILTLESRGSKTVSCSRNCVCLEKLPFNNTSQNEKRNAKNYLYKMKNFLIFCSDQTWMAHFKIDLVNYGKHQTHHDNKCDNSHP